MKRSYLLLFVLGIISVTLVYRGGDNSQIERKKHKEAPPTVQYNGIPYVHIREFNKYIATQSTVDARNRTISLSNKENVYAMTANVPVANHNGFYIPLEADPIIKNDEAWLPFSFFQELEELNHKRQEVQNKKPQIKKLSAAEMGQYLDFLQNPISEKAHVSTVDSSLPGASRRYRNGFHEGLDWYSYVCGITINEKTKVYAVGDGTVVRADHHYKELSYKERQDILKIASEETITPEYILDKLRGRSIWIQHEKGVLCRYAHLSAIDPGLKVGGKVKAGDYIGNVGNSGTSEGVENKKEGLHLHLDILLYGVWFWNQYTVKERRKILETIFNPKVC